MAEKIKKYIFRVTNVCDKKCEACCNRGVKQIIKRLDFKKFQDKLNQIAEYLGDDTDDSMIIFTGGEPFFYNYDNGNYNIKSLIDESQRQLPKAIVKIRTSGWAANKHLDALVNAVFTDVGKEHFEVLLGFNLFQKDGKDAYERLGHMIDLLSKYQKRIVVNTIYSKSNVEENSRVIERVLADRGYSYRGFCDTALAHPEKSTCFRSRHKDDCDRMVMLGACPAYNALDQAEDDNFYPEITQTGLCRQLKSGVNQLYYDFNLSFYHCNDPFVDFSVSPVSADKSRSLAEEAEFFVDRMEQLSKKIADGKLQFKNKQKRCAYCTRCVLGNKG